METKVKTKSKLSFFTTIALIALCAILVGFSKTFIHPLISGNKTWPLIIHVHAALVFGWVFIFLTQSLFIQNKKYKSHIFIGKLAVLIAIGAAISIIPAALYQTERELKEGLGQTAISSIVGSLVSATMFLSFVLLAIFYRKKSQVHKRFMLLATIILIWPAWFRWRHYFPNIQYPEIWFSLVLADSLILLAFIWDWLKNKHIHPALLFGGLFIIIENILEVIFFDSSSWRLVANTLYQLLS